MASEKKDPKIEEFESVAHKMVLDADGDIVKLMKSYAVTQSMRSIAGDDPVTNEAYAARAAIIKAELMRLGANPEYLAEWDVPAE